MLPFHMFTIASSFKPGNTVSRCFKLGDLRLGVEVTLVVLVNPKQSGGSSISRATEQHFQVSLTLTQQPPFYKDLGWHCTHPENPSGRKEVCVALSHSVSEQQQETKGGTGAPAMS